MEIFSDIYASYYDLFYKSKNYKKEANYIIDLCKKFNVIPNKILDIGCGTGKHALEWLKMDINVKGIDQSQEMINVANKSFNKLNNNQKKMIYFEKANILETNIKEKYDLITCMFAVLGYIKNTNDLIKTFKKISNSLKKDSLFVCDTWHGNAVLNEKPSIRVHELDFKNKKIFRIAKPNLDTINQIVSINYDIIEISNEKTKLHKENHFMRYFFIQEMILFAEISNMELIYYGTFLSDKKLENNDWNAIWVFRKK